MDIPSSLTRSKTKVSPSTQPQRNHFSSLLVVNVGSALILQVASTYHTSTLWVTVCVLGCAAAVSLASLFGQKQLYKLQHVEWLTLLMTSFLLLGQQLALFTLLNKTTSMRALLFTLLAPVWPQVLTGMTSIGRGLALFAAFAISIVFTPHSQQSSNTTSHLFVATAILGHAVTTFGLDHTKSVMAPSMGAVFSNHASVLGAFALGLPIYLLRITVIPSAGPSLPWVAYPSILSLALSLVYLSSSTYSLHPTSTYLPTLAVASVSGYVILGQIPSGADVAIAFLLGYAVRQSEGRGSAPTFKTLKAHLKTITSNPESRKIFYFLLLNLFYMGIQMLYGVWTNSLGLISDAIHMAFDCMAIGVGLFASVMATWPANERFTYGYARIETLSGFANGIFLILISIFIVFEAIQRILHPPEMNTSQLLLVSSLGLGVNLFGMFAMGGHHHHGHSHSHGHGHGHSHSQTASPSTSHGHSHSSPSTSHGHSHGPASTPHSHGHSHDAHEHHSPSHSHSHDHHDGHEHDDHCRTHGHEQHSHSHSHSHDSTPVPRKEHHHTHSSQTIVIPSVVSGRAHLMGEEETPLTPSYQFGFDSHYESHHGNAPNLHDHSHSHGHGEGHSDNMRGVFLHVMADTLGSVGVIISTLLIQFYGWTGFDPIASLFIAILIAASVVPLVVDTGKILCLDVSSKEVSIREALTELNGVDGLASYASPRFWPKDGSSVIGSIRIRLAPSAASVDPSGPHRTQKATYTRLDKVVKMVDEKLRNRIPGLEELTIQVDS